MKSKTATKAIIGVIFVLTVLLTFIQPSVIHQLAVWASGSFAVLVALALFVVGNWPVSAKPENSDDKNFADLINKMREVYPMASDEDIAATLNIDTDVVKAVRK